MLRCPSSESVEGHLCLNGRKTKEKTMKHKFFKRILSMLLAVVMLIGLVPTAVIPTFAAEL